jgi:hypothetical protein
MADDLIITSFVCTFFGIGLASLFMIAAEERRQRPVEPARPVCMAKKDPAGLVQRDADRFAA